MLGSSPNLLGIITVIQSTSVILVMQAFFNVDISLAIFLDNSLRLEVCVGMQKDMQRIRIIFQYIISTASDKNTGALLCQLQNNLSLNFPHIITDAFSFCIASEKGIGKQALARGIFSLLCDVVLRQPALLGCRFNQLSIIAGNLQASCDLFSNGSSPTSKFS